MFRNTRKKRGRQTGQNGGAWAFFQRQDEDADLTIGVCIDDEQHNFGKAIQERNCRKTWRCTKCSMPMPGLQTHDEHVESIPTIPISHQEDCAICWEKMGDVKDLWQLDCGHTFHRGCMDAWKKRACPLCRRTPTRGNKDHPDIFVVEEVLEPDPEGAEANPICL